MPATATQTAQKPTPKQQQTPKNQSSKGKQEQPKGLAALSQKAGIAAMTVLLILSLFVGNFRALQNVTPKAFIRQGDVQSIVEDRISAANNIVTVSERGGAKQATLSDVADALTAMKKAKTARDISRADQQLTVAVSALIDEVSDSLTGENAAMLTRAADTFSEQGSFLRQEARAYNEQAQKAETLYEKLPTKGLLAQPDMYEGI